MCQRNNGRMEKITFVIPSRNNLEFLQLAYKSIRNLQVKHDKILYFALNDLIKNKVLFKGNNNEQRKSPQLTK